MSLNTAPPSAPPDAESPLAPVPTGAVAASSSGARACIKADIGVRHRRSRSDRSSRMLPCRSDMRSLDIRPMRSLDKRMFLSATSNIPPPSPAGPASRRSGNGGGGGGAVTEPEVAGEGMIVEAVLLLTPMPERKSGVTPCLHIGQVGLRVTQARMHDRWNRCVQARAIVSL